MLPDSVLSSLVVPGSYRESSDPVTGMLYDFELGGGAINDGALGLEYQTWACWYDRSNNVRVAPLSALASSVILFNVAGVKRLSFSFDSNMQPAVAYETSSGVFFYWFDSAAPGYVTTSYPGARTPRVTHDDKRDFESGKSDVLLTYLLDDELVYRQQRDRYLVAYTLRTGLPRSLRLVRAGMNTKYRVQFELR